MRYLLRLAAVVVLLVPLGCGQLNWQEFSSPEGQFSVLMPGTPKAESRQQGPLTVKAWGVEVRNAAYMASTTDLPPGGLFDYAGGIQAMATTHQGKVLSQTDWALDGSKGKGFEMEINQPKGYAVGRMAVVNNRLYQLLVMGSSVRESDANVQKFFNSFKLIK
jgi:hypothetical protein